MLSMFTRENNKVVSILVSIHLLLLLVSNMFSIFMQENNKVVSILVSIHLFYYYYFLNTCNVFFFVKSPVFYSVSF